MNLVFNGNDYYRGHPDGLANLDAFRRNVGMKRELDLLSKQTGIAKYSDLSLVQEAAQRGCAESSTRKPISTAASGLAGYHH